VPLVVALAAAGPAVAAPAELLPPTITAKTTAVTIGSPARFVFRAPAGSEVPVSYVYRLNAGPPEEVVTTNRRATVTIIPTRFANDLSVYSVGADGSFSDTATDYFDAANPPPAADQDLTGDGRPDLLTVGGTAGLASGLWQATGRGVKGQVRAPALDIGAKGSGGSDGNTPAFYDGAQVITGKFFGGSFESFLVYYPTGIRAGVGVVIGGLGNGSVLNPVSGNEAGIADLTDLNGDNPIQLANAYDADGSHADLPGLFAISGDPTRAYSLNYYQSFGAPGSWGFAAQLSATTPTGGTDWQNWRLAAKLLPSGTALVLWNSTTGGLYLWEGVTVDAETGTLTFTQYTLSTGWMAGVALPTLQASDFNGDGVPDLWAVTPAGEATAYLISGLSATAPAKIKALAPQQLS
jgi:hypothetical protein